MADTPHGRSTRMALASLGRALERQSDLVLDTLTSAVGTDADVTEMLMRVRRSGLMHLEIELRAFTYAAEAGMSDEEIALILGYTVEDVRRVFTAPYEAWKRGDERTWNRLWTYASMPTDLDPADDAEATAWVADQHRLLLMAEPLRQRTPRQRKPRPSACRSTSHHG